MEPRTTGIHSRSRPALADLQAHYGRLLSIQAHHLTGNREDAEDLLQDLWLRVSMRLDTLRNPDATGAFLVKTLRRLAANRRRDALRRIRACSLEDLLPVESLIDACIASNVESPEQQLLRRADTAETRRFLEGLLARLGRKYPTQAIAIILHDLEQRPYDELPGKPSTWSSRRERGLKWMRTHLPETEPHGQSR